MQSHCALPSDLLYLVGAIHESPACKTPPLSRIHAKAHTGFARKYHNVINSIVKAAE
jgi:hypothetical protein